MIDGLLQDAEDHCQTLPQTRLKVGRRGFRASLGVRGRGRASPSSIGRHRNLPSDLAILYSKQIDGAALSIMQAVQALVEKQDHGAVN
jgi:hypothetical protein